MKISFLGTGTSQGVPVIGCTCGICQSLDFRDKRSRSSIHVVWDDTSIVVDTGPDFRQQMLRERVSKVDAIIYTHEHKDHTAGMDDVRSFNFLHKIDMPIYARQQVIDQLKREFSYVFAETKYPGVPRVITNVIGSTSFEINGHTILPIEVMHYKLPVLGFRFGDFTYVTDANHISDTELEKIKGSKYFVVNALQQTEHISHFTLDEAIEIAQKVGAEKTYFTHISHRLGKHQEINSSLPEGIELAWDGLKIEL
ncbi:MAG: phosphoribosyl 1,2-cyclic phosphate phosphodiesterase [Cyclobacteriaceae bacterium]